MKSIVTKLVIYKKDPCFDYCPTPYYCEGYFVGGGQFYSYCGITDTQAQEKEIENTFIGDDAMREYWAIKFNNLQEQDRKLILSAFPDIESKDKMTLKDPQELYAIAFRKVLRRFAVVCPRCGGCGNYSTAVAYTRVDDGICHKCNGRGKVLPRLTVKKLEEIKNYFKSEAKK